jgi:hypothetical protein
MKFMYLTGTVSYSNGLKSEVLKFFQATVFCDLGVKTEAAQLSIAMSDRTIVGDLVTGR